VRTRCPGFMISNVLDNFAHFTLADLRFSTRVDVLTDDNGFNSTFSGNQIPLSTNFFFGDSHRCFRKVRADPFTLSSSTQLLEGVTTGKRLEGPEVYSRD